jgi:type I restriction enzyme R subunit
MSESDQGEISSLSQGKSMKEIINDLMDAVDPDKRIEKAKEIFKVESPTEDQIKKASEELVKKACLLFDNPKFRNTLIDIRNRNEQIIDTISQDEVIFVGPVEKQKEKAQAMVDNFRKFIEENKDELTALQIIYRKPYGQRHLTYQEIKELAEAIKKPPYLLTPERLWQAYEQLEKSKVKRGGPQKLLTDIVSLLRFAIGESNTLEPFSDTVEERFKTWLSEQDSMGTGADGMAQDDQRPYRHHPFHRDG